MITLAEAQRLKGVGYQQPTMLPCLNAFGDLIIAKPNSDELIAAIQERFVLPEVKSTYGVLRNGFMVRAENPTQNSMEQVLRPTLLSALVDLYCKLSEDS